MADQLSLFAQSGPQECPRVPGKGLCRDARERADGCPGADPCEHWNDVRHPCGGLTCSMRGSGVPHAGDCERCPVISNAAR
jgi:hypothetical protein